MDRKTAEEFWTTYFGLIMHEGADTCMGNPFKEFIKEARIGTYDALTDDEYHVKYQQAEEISAFWNGRSKRSAGQVFAEALSRTPLSYNEQKDKLGCRYIRSRLQVLLDDQMFDNPDQKEFQLSVEAAQTSDPEASEAISALAS